MGENWLPSVDYVNKINTTTSDFRIAQAEHIISTDELEMRKIEKTQAEELEKIKNYQKNYEVLISSPEEKALYEKFRSQWNKYIEMHYRVIAMSQKNDNENAAIFFKGEMKSLFVELSTSIENLVEINNNGAKDQYNSSVLTYNNAKLILIFVVAISVAVAFGAGAYVVYGVIRPLYAITASMTAISQGKLDTSIPYEKNSNEIGDQARSLIVFRNALVENERARAEQELRKQEAERERKAAMMTIADQFEDAVGTIVTSVSDASSSLKHSANELSGSASNASNQSVAVAAATEEAQANLQSVAAASEQLLSSVMEISEQTIRSAQLAERAMGVAESSAHQVASLAEKAQDIGKIVDMITSIASQTNLLALNATIEAARAGEAGRGFAVVASEVKSLAQQTANATVQISTQIQDIQNSASVSARTIAEIVESVQQINGFASSIASAVEEQNSATQNIARNIQEASLGTSEVAKRIAGVSEEVQNTNEQSTGVLGAADALTQKAVDLRGALDGFLRTVRAA
jgi:methyl-accepting chemotaxis protein